MIDSVEISNFRGFKSLRLRELKRFNILVGPNGTGKTALLEGVFVASANSAEVSLRLRAWRGLGDRIEVTQDKRSLRALWQDLFFSEEEPSFSIVVSDSRGRARSCRAYYESADAVVLPPGPQTIDSAVLVPVVFEWSSNGQVSRAPVQITEKGLKLPGVPPSFFPSVFLPSSLTLSPEENASRYSALSKENKEQAVVKAMRQMYPFVENLSIEINCGLLTIYASIAGMMKKMPVPLISQGVNKFLGVLLAIHSAPAGVVLVDEFENGFYHEQLTPIWSSILRECQKTDTQMFLTTHSMEALRTLLPVLENDPAEFCLLRTGRDKAKGFCTVEQIPGSRFAAALQEGFEIR